MPPITVSTEVDRPAEDVFAYATDPTRFHEWQAASSTAAWTSRASPTWEHDA